MFFFIYMCVSIYVYVCVCRMVSYRVVPCRTVSYRIVAVRHLVRRCTTRRTLPTHRAPTPCATPRRQCISDSTPSPAGRALCRAPPPHLPQDVPWYRDPGYYGPAVPYDEPMARVPHPSAGTVLSPGHRLRVSLTPSPSWPCDCWRGCGGGNPARGCGRRKCAQPNKGSQNPDSQVN